MRTGRVWPRGCPRLPSKRASQGSALIAHDDYLLRDVELGSLTTAQQPDGHTLSRLRTIPGSGALLRVGLLDAIQDIQRFPRGQEFVSSCRFVQCARASAGRRDGTSGTQSGHAALPWAFSEAAVL